MTFDSNPGIARLDAIYPCRRDQFRMLYLLLGDPNFPSPPVVCLTGFPKGGKRSCARAFLKETSSTYIWIDCLETLSPALFFTKLVNELRKLEDPESPRIRLNADTTSSVGAVREALQSLNGKIVLALENPGCLKDMAPGSLLSVLTRLPTLASTSSNVQLVMLLISDSLPLRAFDATPLPQIDFPAYTKPEIQKILGLHAPDSLYSTSNRPDVEGDLDPAELKKIWNGLTSAVIDTYGVGMALDVPTILKISRNLWPEIVQPIIDHGVIEEETGEMVYGRVDFTGLFALAKRKGLFTGEEVLKRFLNLNANHITQVRYELPVYMKFLLVSAFLASYNPSRHDVRIFSHQAASSKRVKRAGVKSNKGIAKMSQRLIGPKVFELERMMAIFHSITNYQLKQTVDIHSQIATLSALKLILRISRGDPLQGGGRWKVNVPEEEVRRIAGSVGFSLNDHLVD